jgi:hypothetical protein
MSHRTVISIAAAAILGIACISTEALAYRGGGARVGGYHGGGARVGGVYRGGAYRGAYVRPGVGVGIGAAAVGAAAVGAAIAAPYYYNNYNNYNNNAACGYYPYPPCY